MIKVIQRSGLLISREHENEEFYKEIKKHLTRRSRAYQSSEFEVSRFYIESEKFLLLPRYFPINKFVPNPVIDNHQQEGEQINIQHNITPRSELQEKTIAHILENDRALLQLAPGVGKTVISIYVVGERKRKTLVLVHLENLAKQWRERFIQFTNLEDDDIALLSSTTFKDDFQKPIIISTVQTFKSCLKRQRADFLFALNDAKIGIMIADEVHTSVGAPSFSECSIHVPAKYTYGLSATPYRYDGNGDIIEYHLGKIFSDNDIEGTMIPKVTVLLVHYDIDQPKSRYYLYWGGEFQKSRYLTMMRKSKPFIAATTDLLNRLCNEREMLVVVERKKIIDDLYSKLNVKSKSKFYASASLDALKSKVSFATPGKCRDGIDAPWKDCVIMTSPISNVEQLTGRIVRNKPGKKTPIIIDMVDFGCQKISRTFYSRLDFYDAKEWSIRFLLYYKGKVTNVERDQAMQILSGA
jgi:superfamily II DNA or RNA helicase